MIKNRDIVAFGKHGPRVIGLLLKTTFFRQSNLAFRFKIGLPHPIRNEN